MEFACGRKWPTQCSGHSLLKQQLRDTIVSCWTALALCQMHYSMVFLSSQYQSKLSTLCSAWSTFSMLGHKVQVAPAPQNRSQGVRLEFIWGICPSMPVVWLLCLIHATAKYLHSITLSLMTFFNHPLHRCRNGSPPLGGPAPAFGQEGNQQRVWVSSGLDG